MKQISLLALVLIISSYSVNAQSKKKKDKEAIKEMCGCFEVTFKFAETFEYSEDSLYVPSKQKIATALEWAQLITNEKNKISIQHLLQVGPVEHPHIIKHWRQDWLYQNQDLYLYNGDNEWVYEQKSKKEVRKQWTQKVYQVDDSPRYEGSSTWVHVDGKSYWENTTPAPLPRREYTKRSDYTITLRGNRHEITSTGWIHDQDNSKIVKEKNKKDFILANEKGYNTYVKVADNKCKPAADWWTKNESKWAMVRAKWAVVYGKNTTLNLETKVENKPLYKYLFSEEYNTEKTINKVIESFVKN